jgi:glutamyl-tRNA synthetase
VPDSDFVINDLVRGEIIFPAGSFPDFVIVRPNGQPLYTLVNPVDDALMGITHVLRGEDLLSSTPRQVALYNALFEAGIASFVPQFGHLPFVMGEGNKKLSKRDPESNLFLHKDRGFIPEGLLNYLSLLGWSIGPDRDIFSMQELIDNFEITNVNPNPARFDQVKADSINSSQIRLLAPDDFENRISSYLASANLISDPPTENQSKVLAAAAPLIQERITVLSEAVDLLSFLFTEEIEYHPDSMQKLPQNSVQIIETSVSVLTELANWDTESIHAALNQKLITELELKPRIAFGPLRSGISGRRVSPPLFESMEILGREKTIARLNGFAAQL